MDFTNKTRIFHKLTRALGCFVIPQGMFKRLGP
jgi:hypothetical protein